ncbi:MAG: hypothetical protein LAN84_14295 [Acidobacteriia bacterium]|nr:hypothetical protein [Terriglobia bacterium]
MAFRFFRKSRLAAHLLLLACALLAQPPARAQQAAEAPAPGAAGREEFIAAAGEVLQQVSVLTQLPARAPLKKSLRSRAEIRAYVLRRMQEDKSAEERYAADRAAVAFGLVPEDFQMEPFLVELLTEQIAGLYDPEGREFYIADWIPLQDQRMVMAHELTHALEDQHFHIEAWMKAARPNDDAELAREAVLEGSATAAMMDYELLSSGRRLSDLPDLDPQLLLGDLSDTPALQRAPAFIKDALLFPYFSGLRFSMALLKPAGWSALPGVFARPPVSSQQILHPELYREGRVPVPLDLAVDARRLRGEWKLLEDNILGEFGWREVLQQFLGRERGVALAQEWAGDRYVLFEQARTKKLLLIYRVRWSDAEHAARFFGQYSEALEKKYAQREQLFRRPNFFSFETPRGGVFLRCVEAQCLAAEGGTRALFDDVSRTIGWSAAPKAPEKELQKIAAQRQPAAAVVPR